MAAKILLATSLDEIDAGNQDLVVAVLRDLESKLIVTYENHGNFKELVAEAVIQMKDEQPVKTAGSPDDVTTK